MKTGNDGLVELFGFDPSVSQKSIMVILLDKYKWRNKNVWHEKQ